VLASTTSDLYHTLTKELIDAGGYTTIISEPSQNYIIAVPSEDVISSICLVAHIDTVRSMHDEPVNLIIQRHKVTNRSGVLGADDRAGVFAILEIIKLSEVKPIVIFTNFEESGGKGVKALIRDKKLEPYLSSIDLFIELDRQGHNDWVYYYANQHRELREWIEYYGYIEARGSYSDVFDLSIAYHIPHFNLSVGYYGQHSDEEYLDLQSLAICIDNVGEMLMEGAPRVKLTSKNFIREYKQFPLRRAQSQWQSQDGLSGVHTFLF
jgi:hypothetical protein